MIAIAVLAVSTVAGPAQASNGTSGQGIQPISKAGNFVASDDDQVCYEIAKQGGYTSSLDREVRGFKIDPAVDFSNEYVNFTVSADGRYLDWSSTNAEVLAVIVKGGPNYHLYKYQGTGLSSDTGLHSPVAKKNVPQISHYNVCYMPDQAEGQGCTPGF